MFLIIAAILLLGGYSGPSQSSPPLIVPQFHLGRTDVSKMSKSLIKGNPSIPRPDCYIFHLALSDARAIDFQKFTRQHLNEKVEIVLGTNVIAEPIIRSEVTNGMIVAACPADQINKITEAYPKH